jgi:hypothetical protein
MLPNRVLKRRNEVVETEIKELKESAERLSIGEIPLRVRVSLRKYEYFYMAAKHVRFLYGMIIGLWWPVPLLLLFDNGEDSIRSQGDRIAEVIADTAKRDGELADKLSDFSFVAILVAFLVAYYLIIGVGPIILSIRVGMGFVGRRVPGRRVVLTARKSYLVYRASRVVNSCAAAYGSRGQMRTKRLEELAAELSALASEIAIAHRFARGRLRRRRKSIVKGHLARVASYLRQRERNFDTVSDEDLEELGSLVLTLADRCAHEQYGNLLSAEKLRAVEASDREALRLVLGAVLFLSLSSVLVALIGFLDQPSVLYGVAIGASLVVSICVVFGPRAMEKIEQFGIFGRQ